MGKNPVRTTSQYWITFCIGVFRRDQQAGLNTGPLHSYHLGVKTWQICVEIRPTVYKKRQKLSDICLGETARWNNGTADCFWFAYIFSNTLISVCTCDRVACLKSKTKLNETLHELYWKIVSRAFAARVSLYEQRCSYRWKQKPHRTSKRTETEKMILNKPWYRLMLIRKLFYIIGRKQIKAVKPYPTAILDMVVNIEIYVYACLCTNTHDLFDEENIVSWKSSCSIFHMIVFALVWRWTIATNTASNNIAFWISFTVSIVWRTTFLEARANTWTVVIKNDHASNDCPPELFKILCDSSKCCRKVFTTALCPSN